MREELGVRVQCLSLLCPLLIRTLDNVCTLLVYLCTWPGDEETRFSLTSPQRSGHMLNAATGDD